MGFNEFELAVRRIADTDDGQVFFRHLTRHKITKRCSPNFGRDGIAIGMAMAFADGEANVIRELNNIIERDEK
jgi:hypothetical protein